MQKWQSDFATAAGMASVMAGSMGWWHLEMLLVRLASQAQAGARPELLPLMKVR